MLGLVIRHVGAGSPAPHRLRLAANVVLTRGKAVERASCRTVSPQARWQSGSASVPTSAAPLQQVFTRWDGKGVPSHVSGEEFALPMRLFHLADTVEVFHAPRHRRRHRGGPGAARDGFDPKVVDVFCDLAPEVLGDTGGRGDCHALIESESSLQRRLTESELDGALEAIADFTDLRSPSRAGHSRGVADLGHAQRRTAVCPRQEVVPRVEPGSSMTRAPRGARDGPREAGPLWAWSRSESV